MEEKVAKLIAVLRDNHKHHMSLGLALFKPGTGIYPLDLLAFASLNRSLQLTMAFCDLIETKRLLAAAPLVRLQLDNALRFSAAFQVNEPHKLAMDILDGQPVRKMTAANGQKMTDQYLVTQLAQAFPWVKSVYEHTSGFIHLSEKHYFAALRVSDDSQEQPGTFSGYISATDQYVPTNAYVEALEGFREISRLFFALVSHWRDLKAEHAPPANKDMGSTT